MLSQRSRQPDHSRVALQRSLPMADWQLQANAPGIGELIAHRRLFRVPDHQRDYAWAADDEVSQFLDDIWKAVVDRNPDYFLGLLVLVTPGLTRPGRFW